MSDNIKVVVKVRPLISREIEDKLSFQWRVKNNTLYQLDSNGKDSGVQYTFDKVYDVSTKTTDVYEDVAKPIVEAAIAGFNGTIFAYGQTSSGKTYTMSGTETSPGIIQLAIVNLFERIKCIPDRDFLVRVSYLEIYNESLKDLLNVENDKIKIRDNPQGGIRVDATEKFTTSPEEVMAIMREGEANRQIGATNMNEESSRSHSIFQITIESREHCEGEETLGCVNVSQLNLVDLAGSERSGQTGATGKRFKEGTHINKSLSVLALVIKQLSEDPHKHANYRDSKLTRILQNSLGGNAKTSIICAVTPAAVEETISTLQFANRAKAIKNKPEVNAVATDATKLQDLTKQLSKLQSELAMKNNVEQDNRFLQKQIDNLQKLVLNGFGQRSLDVGGARRKTWCAPRRMTISTSSLRSVEEIEPEAPRFCTPSLKYNPLSLPTARDFQPIQRPSQLPPVCEERAMITPPPTDKKVNFSDEIIDLDSDEDNASNTSRCSPYHKCYNSTKTPPCVLRKNAKKAEESLRDIVELTKRERLYNPDVVEYMEKLEKTTNKVAELEDEIKSLNAVNKEKDLEMEQLKAKITHTRIEIETISSSKAELEAQCKECNTKLTDLEVCYETLKRKAKLREDELLSLLNEQTNSKKPKESIPGKSLSRTFDKDFVNFMDMSKDISLVSDNDSSVDSSNTEPSMQLQRLVDEMRTEVTAKNEAIVQLESDLLQQKLAIESLESTVKDLREQIIETNSKLNYTEEENSLLKSSIETLNSTINSQKQNLDSANNDIESYNAVIKELQAQLSNKKYDHIDFNVSDVSLKQMIDNEEKFIANNENMRNIIHSFKIALDTRNKKIEQLESNQKLDTLSETESMSKQLEEKEKVIIRLAEEVHNSKELIQENINVINKLMEDNKNLVKDASDLSDKLLNAEKQSSELEKRVQQLETENKDYKQQLHEFNENHDKLLKNLNDFKSNMGELEKEKEELCALKHEVLSKDSIIADLKSELTSKDSQISSLSSEQMESQDYLCKWKSTVSIVQDLLVRHTGDVSVQTEFADDSSIFEALCRQLSTVENSVSKIVSQKELALVNNSKLKEEIEALQSQVECLISDKNKAEIDKDNLNEHVVELTKNLEKVEENLLELSKQNADLNTKLQSASESQDKLSDEIIQQEKIITSLKNEKNDLHVQLDRALQLDVISRNEIENLKSLLTTNEAKFDEILRVMSNEITELKRAATERDMLLDENCIELQKVSKTLEETICNRDQLLSNIYEAAIRLLSKLENHTNEYQLLKSNVYSNIIEILDRVSNEITTLTTCKTTDDNSTEMNQRLEIFKEENQQLINKISYLEKENSDLLVELEQIKIDNKKMSNELLKSDKVLKQVEIELHEKLFTIENLQFKINEWKNNFSALEESMKQQILELKMSNSDIESQSQTSIKKTSDLSIKSNDTYILGPELNNVESDRICNTLDGLLLKPGYHSPQSLLSLCCNKIIDAIQNSETELTSVDSTCFQTTSTETQTQACDCERLLTEKSIVLDENLELKAKVDYLQSINIQLLKEQEEIREELKLFIEPAQELQKKISNHKTSLSTLTATTYAENKLLKSQVKVLQHHNNRIYNVCQRDLPTFKKSLQELSSILKNTPSINVLESHIKRLSLPEVLDRSSSAFKDESALDGDLLMLDTNVTLASVDNTLLVQDQTCLDGTQIYLDTDINNDIIATIDPNILHTQLQMLSVENEKLTEKLNALKQENLSLHEQIDRISDSVKPEIRTIDSQNSPMKLNNSLNGVPVDSIENNHTTGKLCEYCNNENNPLNWENMTGEIEKLTVELLEVKLLKSDLEKKYNNLNEEIIANDQLIIKINTLEKNNNKQLNMIDQLTNKLSSEHNEVARLQEENDTLSTQVMETIDESDKLRKEIDTLKEINTTLRAKCADLEELTSGNTIACIRCAHNTSTPETPIKTKSVLNRSRSDSENSSRCNKLSTLQNELLAGREDCKTISEDVATIKNHLERGDLSMSGMDLDVSMGESNAFPFPKELNTDSQKTNKSKLVEEIQDERQADMYTLDKSDCLKYYVEKTEAEINFKEDIKIIDVMMMLYDKIIAKHGNEVENLVNKLKDYEESKNQLQQKLESITSEYSKTNDLIKEKDHRIECIAKTLNQLRNNINNMNEEICGCDAEKNSILITMFKSNILNILDSDFDLSSVNIFENLIDKVVSKHQNDLLEIMNQYSELQGHMETLSSELKTVTDNLDQMKCQLSEKEKEYNLLKAQKEKAHEISSAVTLDIVQREQELTRMITSGCQTLIEHNIISPNDIDSNRSVDKNISLLIEMLINQSKQTDVILQEKHNLTLEVTKSKTALEEKDQELEALKIEVDKLRELCKSATNELMFKNEALETQKSLNEQLDEIYQKKAQENDANVKIVEKMTQELEILKIAVSEKETILKNLQQTNENSDDIEAKAKISELMESIKTLEHENKNLKSVNDMITSEGEQTAAQLAEADATIKMNKLELDKLTAEILTLNQSVKDSVSVIEGLKLEAKSLVEQNIAIKKQFEEASELCSQLKLNIKTHEKTAEIQCKIISRLKQEKEESSGSRGETEKTIKELSEQCDRLRSEYGLVADDRNKCKHEAQELREAKEALQTRVAELEVQLESFRSRGSVGAPAQGQGQQGQGQAPGQGQAQGQSDSRRRRQSLLDSKRTFSDDKLDTDHKKMESYFSTQEKPDDMFMDVDDHSNRSTPARNRRSDSFQSRNEEGEEPPRPSSALERRRRRQSMHDQHRNTRTHPPDHLNQSDERNKTIGGDHNSEVATLKERLLACQQELEELRERYREVDEECETCAEYLRERDEQCMRLKTENKSLQQQIAKLTNKLQNASLIRGEKDAQRSFADASVNTDEDWANLHSVVVDRMSFDREVEKNKSLQRTVDELRFKNGELKAAAAKLQKTAERAARNKANLLELEATKLELETCRRELEEYKERCRELDEECETCGEYLRERDEQLTRLKEAKDALEAKLEALQEKEASDKLQQVRKKRQSVHDRHRDSVVDTRDAATLTGEELIFSLVDNSRLINESLQTNEVAQLKMALERVSQQKQLLETQLRAAPVLAPPVYVATGSAIVQNQHLTEVMKENQKLKKMNAKLITICKKRGKPLGESNRENDDPADIG